MAVPSKGNVNSYILFHNTFIGMLLNIVCWMPCILTKKKSLKSGIQVFYEKGITTLK